MDLKKWTWPNLGEGGGVVRPVRPPLATGLQSDTTWFRATVDGLMGWPRNGNKTENGKTKINTKRVISKTKTRRSPETNRGTHEDERTVLCKTKSLDGTKPNTNPIQLFYAFIEHRPLIFTLAQTVLGLFWICFALFCFRCESRFADRVVMAVLAPITVVLRWPTANYDTWFRKTLRLLIV